MHNLQCLASKVQFSSSIVQCAVLNVQCAICNNKFAVSSPQFTGMKSISQDCDYHQRVNYSHQVFCHRCQVGEKVGQTLKVTWHEIILFLNMLPINAFIEVAFLFFQVWLGNLAQIPSSQKLVPETGACISLLL